MIVCGTNGLVPLCYSCTYDDTVNTNLFEMSFWKHKLEWGLFFIYWFQIISAIMLTFHMNELGIKPCNNVVYHPLTTPCSRRLCDWFHKGAATSEFTCRRSKRKLLIGDMQRCNMVKSHSTKTKDLNVSFTNTIRSLHMWLRPIQLCLKWVSRSLPLVKWCPISSKCSCKQASTAGVRSEQHTLHAMNTLLARCSSIGV